jgi:hypothetical protein
MGRRFVRLGQRYFIVVIGLTSAVLVACSSGDIGGATSTPIVDEPGPAQQTITNTPAATRATWSPQKLTTIPKQHPTLRAQSLLKPRRAVRSLAIGMTMKRFKFGPGSKAALGKPISDTEQFTWGKSSHPATEIGFCRSTNLNFHGCLLPRTTWTRANPCCHSS